MKAKKLDKKLVLNKQTVVDLKVKELNVVRGGAPSKVTPCGNSLLSFCCPVSYIYC